MSALGCRRTPPMTSTCIERLADGFTLPQDLCSGCTRAFMSALDGIAGPLKWHPNFTARAAREGVAR